MWDFFIGWLANILEVEREHLASEPSELEERAGASSLFAQYYEFNTVEQLAGNDPTKFESVLKLDYNTAFTHLRYMNTMTKYQRKLNKLATEKK